jgi:hypothetical protein
MALSFCGSFTCSLRPLLLLQGALATVMDAADGSSICCHCMPCRSRVGHPHMIVAFGSPFSWRCVSLMESLLVIHMVVLSPMELSFRSWSCHLPHGVIVGHPHGCPLSWSCPFVHGVVVGHLHGRPLSWGTTHSWSNCGSSTWSSTRTWS